MDLHEEREIIDSAARQLKESTAAVLAQKARIEQLEGQVRQLRRVLRAINRSSFDALGVGAELDGRDA